MIFLSDHGGSENGDGEGIETRTDSLQLERKYYSMVYCLIGDAVHIRYLLQYIVFHLFLT